MRKIFFLIIMAITLGACRDFVSSSDGAKMEKDSLANVVGIDKDENGCVGSAGYRWSVLKKACIRPFEDGVRLNPATEIKAGDPVISAFVILEDLGNKAEVYLPSNTSSIILERKSEGKPYTNNVWQLFTDKGFLLQKGDSIIYAGAVVDEEVITGSDSPED